VSAALVAAFKISIVRSSSAFFRFNSRISRADSDVTPSALPASIWACRTQRRRALGVVILKMLSDQTDRLRLGLLVVPARLDATFPTKEVHIRPGVVHSDLRSRRVVKVRVPPRTLIANHPLQRKGGGVDDAGFDVIETRSCGSAVCSAATMSPMPCASQQDPPAGHPQLRAK